jgi:hypothetical protein
VHVNNIKFFICPTNAHNSYNIVELLKSFTIIIFVPTCFGLHKSSSGSSQPVLRKVTMLISVTYFVFEVIDPATVPITSNNDM